MKKLFLLLLVSLSSCISAAGQNEPPRPHIFGIAGVQILAANRSASLGFYSKPLNLAHDPDETLLSQMFFLNPFQDIDIWTPHTPTPANLIAQITFSTDDIPALRRYLVSHKIAVIYPPISSPGWRDSYFTVVDPEGHGLGFVQRRKGEAPVHAQPASLTHSTFRLIHAGFVVRDRAATDHFYKDILGFRPYWHGGMKDDKDDWVAMQVPDGTDWVEYMLNIPLSADHHTLGVMNHIALGVPDIQAARAQLLKNGWKPGEEPKLGRDGKWQLNLYDPDDTRVEFMEFIPKEKPCCSEFTGPHPGPKQ
jgi:catechol 2,3-dioxygenase-like lactoylglutathione lyase family enzyme/predicted enzyme related to lactoylglutathione lyase